MANSEIEARVRAILEPLLPNAASIGSDTLLARVGLDSLAAVELTLAIEEEFDIVLDDDDLALANFASIDAIASMLSRRLGGS